MMTQRETQPSSQTASLGRFAGAAEAFADGRLSPTMHCADRRFRPDNFERFALTFERLGDLTDKRGLDVGCGSGHYIAEALRRRARQVVGIDPAPGMLELARRRIEALGHIDRVEFVPGFFPQQVPPGPFDFAIVIGVLDYIAEPVAFMTALRRIVNGRVAVSFPSKHWFHTPIRRWRCRLRNCTVYAYDEPTIRSIGAEAGFGSIDVVKLDGAGMDFHVCLKP